MDYEVIKEFKGAPDGHTVVTYKVGDDASEETMGADLLKVAIDEKWVKPCKLTKAQAKAEAEAKAKAEEEAKARAEAEKKAEAITTLEKEIAQLKLDYDAAEGEEAKAAIVKQAEAKQAELDALLAE